MSQVLTEKRRLGTAGYFRIGDVTLTIPPEEIVTNKVINNQEVSPLRSRFAMFQKTGLSRWDVTISWKALLHPGVEDTLDYSEFETLQRILAMFVAAPFVEVENAHLRQFVAENDPGFLAGDRMSFAMRQLRVDTLGDVVDGLQVTLTLSLFNSKPYSTDFAYKGETENERVSAGQSKAFKEYLDGWIKDNLTNPRILKSYPALTPWVDQTPGTLTFKWREYSVYPKDLPAGSQYPQIPETSKVQGPQSSVPPVTHKSKSAAKAPDAIKAIVQQAASQAGLDPNLALAVCQVESGFRPDVVNPTSSATGLFQLTKQTQKQLGVTNPTDPVANARAGCAYIAQFLRQNNGDVVKALTAFTAGPGSLQKLGLNGSWAKFPWIPQYIADVTSIAKQLGHGSAPAAVTAAVTLATPVAPAQSPFQPDLVQPSVNLSPETVVALATAGWFVDHETNTTAFLYRPHDLILNDQEHGDASDSSGSRLHPTQFSVLFVNQLAPLPLEAYSIATYQHIGAASTRVSISLLSDGDMQFDGEGNAIEPEHPGLSQLAGAVSLLENQFHAMKLQWRSVASVHRMQALVVENQILNLLGIYAVIPQALQTTTLPDSPTLVQANLQCSQYENVFEQLSAYQVKGVGSYDDVWQKEVFEDSADFQQAVAANPILSPLQQVAQQMRDGNLLALYDYLGVTPKLPPVPTNVALTIDEQKMLYRSLPALQEKYPDLATRVSRDSSLNFNDVLALGMATKDSKTKAWFTEYMDRVRMAVRLKSPDPVSDLYKTYLAYSVVNGSRSLSSAVGQLEASTQFANKLKNQVDPKGPGHSQDNLDHVAYRDLGLYDLNDQPASYFYDDASAWTRRMQEQGELAATSAIETINRFNTVAGSAAVQADDRALNPSQDSKGQKDQIKEILNRTLIPNGSLRRAFPTFKLFLIEDANQKTYYMFDDFYSYASVLSLEVIGYQDKPDTAVIQITNIANLLTHKLYDTSVEGRYEFRNSPDFDQPHSTDGSAIANPGGAQSRELIGKTSGGYTYQYNQMQPGFDASGKRVPLQYFALQTGTKIQVRMGYANNPDDLTPVFSGVVTNIEDGPIMTLTAQGFGVELIDPDPELVDQTMGGYFSVNGGGEAINVMGRMLKTERAKHFGHWQVGVPSNAEEQLLQGWSWKALAGDVLSAAGATTLGTLAKTTQDRSRENLLIDHHFLPNGTYTQGFSSVGFQIERNWLYEPVTYSIPKDMSLTPWMIIQDVKRRYPEFMALTKLYGYPFGCDATLVYGSPNSFYVARPTLSNQSELSNLSKTDAVEFRQWWGQNKGRFKDIVASMSLPFTGDLVTSILPGNWASKIDAAGDNAPAVFNEAVDTLIVTAGEGISVLRVPTFGNRVDLFGIFHRAIAVLENAQVELRNLRTSAIMAIQFQKNPASIFKASNRIQPIRKWILVTSENIIKNSIVLNDNFYNAVRVGDETFSVNEGMDITKGNKKLLDCDKRIIDVKNNVKPIGGMKNRYAQSFLRDELARMYRGELHLTGIPEIQAGDVLLLVDRSTGMMGPIEVGTVIHSFDQEMGYITIVKPNALVGLNEAMTAGILDGMWQLFQAIPGEVSGFLKFGANHPGAIATGAAGVVGTGAVGYGATLTAFGKAQLTKQIVAKAAKTGLGQAISKVGQTAAAQTVRAGGAAALEAAGTVATEVGLTSAALVSAPALAVYAAVALGVMSVLASTRQKMNPLFLMPINRFGRPWVAGVDGWSLNDLSTSVDQTWNRFRTYELEPYLQLVRDAVGAKSENSIPWLDRTIALLGDS
jgi:hypothetical protein